MSGLRAAAFIARKDLQYLLRQRATLVWTFLMPPVFFFFIGSVTGGFAGGGDERPALAVDSPEPAGFLADELVTRLDAEGYDVRRDAGRVADPADRANPADTPATRRLVLPTGFTDSLTAGREVTVRLAREGALDPAARWDQIRVGRAVYGMLADAALAARDGGTVDAASIARERERPRLYTLDVKPAGQLVEPPVGFQQAVPGTMVMFTLLVLLTSGAVLLVIERIEGLLRRVASAPLPREGVVAGKWASRLALGIVQIGFAMALGTLLFDVNWGPDLPMVALVLLAWASFAAGLAILAGNLVRTEGQAIAIGVFSANLLAALGGCWWPIEITPEWAQKVALALPTGWTMDALHRLMNFQAGALSAVPHVIALATATLVVGWAAARTFRFD
ncbi:MAG TPA: ABC transporter permease [Longimicrobiaceae bacterium]|nr:ABC transporter permease [Longimicrobiaceae bacterium]